jgi:hypothetical protein
MQQYCINGFNLMLIFIKDELLIRIEDTPYFHLIQEVVKEYEKAIDVESVKLSLENKSNQQPQQTETTKPDRFKNELWFKVGLLFASGEMEKYYSVTNKKETAFKNNYSAPKVAKELGFDNYNKFILATINNYPKDNPNRSKNIFNSRIKMNKIINHCEINNIEIIPYFLSRLPTE